MSKMPSIEVKVFICYAHEDKLFRDELDNHLSALKHSDKITVWSDREILAGTDVGMDIQTHLNESDLILLLVSAYFLASDYCNTQMALALERQKEGKAHIVPVLVRDVSLEGSSLEGMKLSPANDKPIISWPDRDAAFNDVVQDIGKLVASLLEKLKAREEKRQNIVELEAALYDIEHRLLELGRVEAETRKAIEKNAALQQKFEKQLTETKAKIVYHRNQAQVLQDQKAAWEADARNIRERLGTLRKRKTVPLSQGERRRQVISAMRTHILDEYNIPDDIEEEK